MPTFNPLFCLKVFLLLWISSIFSLATAFPTDKKQDSSNSPQTSAGKLLKLALEKAEKLKQEQWTYKARHGLKVQKQDGPRHDREWARQRKSNKDKDEQGH